VINDLNKIGRTLLFVACFHGRVDIVKELVGCDGIEVNKGVSALKWFG